MYQLIGVVLTAEHDIKFYDFNTGRAAYSTSISVVDYIICLFVNR